ncbi:MAG: DMT family transporter [Phocaeicola sp.]|uniref:DMT family transporter n=1 Tax=Phocaeicola TaxID=909656 RepID=UPI00234EBD6D|nr:DMT family transporter [Phocaeicola oris]MCE2616333.1 DMT family transporter [Phocaeicola oris]
MDRYKLKGHSAVFMANVIFGLGVPVTKLLLDNWVTPIGYIATRSLGAAIIFWIVQCFAPKEKVVTKDLIVILLGGLLGFVVSQTLTSFSLYYTSPFYYSLVAAMTPVAVMLLATVFIKEQITTRSIIGVLLALLGGMLMIFASKVNLNGGSNDLLGIFLAILSLLTWAVYLIVTRKISSRYSPVTQMKWVFLISALVTVPFAMKDFSTNKLYTSGIAWDGIIEMAFIVVFATVLGYFLIPFAMKYLKATTVSVYTNLQTVVAAFVAMAIGQDILTWDKPIAGILILVGAYIVTTRNDDSNSSPVKK